MTNERIAELFTAALELPESEREAFLNNTDSTQEIRSEVSRLLSAHEKAGVFLERTASREKAALVAFAEEETMSGASFGPYRVTRELGRGGMGVVYLAERTGEDFQQRVALKVIRGGPTTGEIYQRFVRERMILAGMEHPGVARLMDGGVTDEGIPFFAMEYVEGEPITAYCDRTNLDIEARLRLFVEVCRTVQYAHGRLVVHRDLKPTNILVTPEGKTRLLDFGIAKLLDEGAEGQETLTRQGRQAMTPEYAAPEQLRGEAITTATDVYALGVLLYRLLSGHHPFDHEKKSGYQWAEVVCNTDPQAPSVAVDRQLKPASVEKPNGKSPSLTPKRLKRRLQGDLDTVTLKALRKKPTRRYVSAEALADDLERHLQGLPVRARKATAGYRISRFIHRHRLGAMGAALLLGSLLFGLAGTAWQASVAAEERDRAEQEAAKAEEVKDFVLSLFEASDPAESKGAEITSRELLDRGAERIDTELSDQPVLQAEMFEVIGGVNLSLAEYPQAEALFERALGLRQGMGDDPVAIALTMRLVADAKQVLGKFEGAEEIYRDVLKVQQAHLGHQSSPVGRTLNDLGGVLTFQGNYEEAEAIYRESLMIQRQSLGEDHPDTIETNSSLGTLQSLKGDYKAAEETFRKTLEKRRKAYGDEHLSVANEMADLATVLLHQGKYPESEELLRNSLVLSRKFLGDEHPDVGGYINNLAAVLRKQGRFADAEPLARQVLDIDRKAFGEEHLWVAMDLDNLGVIVAEQGRLQEAIILFEEGHGMFDRVVGPEHPDTAMNNLYQGRVHRYQGPFQKAERILKKSLDVFLLNPGPDSPKAASAFIELGDVYADQGDNELAQQNYEKALAIQQKALRLDHPDLILTQVGLANALLSQSRIEEAETLLRGALLLGESGLPEGHWRISLTQSALGEILRRKGAPDADTFLQRGYEGLHAIRGDWHPATRRAKERLLATAPP